MITAGLAKSITPIFQGMAQSIVKAFSPVTYIMQGFSAFMEPFSVFGDLAEAIGSSLSLMLLPIIQEIVGFITPFIPILQALAMLLAPILLFFFNLVNPLGKIISLISLISDWTGFDIMGQLPNILTNALGSITGLVSQIFLEIIPTAIRNLIEMIGQLIMGAWNDIGTRLTGGGADKSGWW
jgi:hypothetical protein